MLKKTYYLPIIAIHQLRLYDKGQKMKKPYSYMNSLRHYRTSNISICLIPREIILQMTILKPHLQAPDALI